MTTATLAAGGALGANVNDSAKDAPPPGARLPHLEFVYECEVTISEPLEFGKTAEGQRRVIPITGGHFQGPRMRGTVLPLGADWNLRRSDGAGSVEAAYYLKTEDGVLIRIINKGVSDGSPPATEPNGEVFFMFTTPVFEAPPGKYDWLNRATFVATLGGRRDVHGAVLIRVFQVS